MGVVICLRGIGRVGSRCGGGCFILEGLSMKANGKMATAMVKASGAILALTIG